MSGLVEFLRARLDEDAELAQSAHGPAEGPWWSPEDIKTRLCDDQIWMRDAEHMSRHSPARVLAEVEAKRRVLDDALPTMQADELRIAGEWGVGTGPDRAASDDLLSFLALPYAGHPDYREEWKP